MNSTLTYPDYPLTAKALDAYKLRSYRNKRPTHIGGHLNLLRGQSMEFFEMKKYVYGDNFKDIDWRASARFGASLDRVVRTYHSEEKINLYISIDSRPSLYFPVGQVPMKVAAMTWLAASIFYMVRSHNDHVFINQAFSSDPFVNFERVINDPKKINEIIWQSIIERKSSTANSFITNIPHSSIWVIITDIYFPEDVDSFLVAIRKAALRYCWVIIIELDTWDYERQSINTRSAIIDGPGAKPQKRPVLLSTDILDNIEKTMEKHRNKIFNTESRYNIDHTKWVWSRDSENPNWFANQLFNDSIIRRIFER